MNKRKINILGIAPYSGMENIMSKLAEGRNDLNLTTFVGDISSGTDTLSDHLMENYDVVISRGGTAELLKNLTKTPVIEISISIYDILRTIKLAENYAQNYAIVGFSSITSTAHTLCDLLQYKVDIITIDRTEEISNILSILKSKNCNVIICDTITSIIAKDMGLNPILITSGPESIQSAFDQAIKVYNDYASLEEKNYVLTKTLEMQTANTIILDDNKSVYFSNCVSDNSESIINYLKSILPDSQSGSFEKSFHLIENTLYSISLNKIRLDKQNLFIFSIEPNPVLNRSSKHGIRFTDCNETKDKYYNSFYNLTLASLSMNTQIEQINLTSLPVIILGEKGTGKDMVASKLYFESNINKNPFIVINCELLNDKSWDFLVNNYNSPFCDNRNTIFISNIQALSQLQRKQLLTLIMDTNLHKRNRIILSCSQTLKNNDCDPSRDFIEYLSCITLYLPPLRDLKEDLLSSSSLYLNTLNLNFSKQVVGFEPDAIALLSSYYWPQNFIQLKRVLMELVMLTNTPYITAESVESILAKESQQFPIQNSSIHSINFNYDKPLSDIIQDVVHIVLSQCNNNQSQAAKKLGISRTTLWRYLK